MTPRSTDCEINRHQRCVRQLCHAVGPAVGRAVGRAVTMGPILIAMIAGGSGCATAPHTNLANDEIREGYLRTSLRDALERRRSGAAAAHEIAASFWRSGLTDSSRAYLELAIAIDATHLASLTWLSRIYYEQGAYSAGINLLEPVIEERDLPDPEILANLSVLKLATGELSAAEELLRTCTELHPHYAPAFGNLGYLHLQLGEHEQAASELREAILLDTTMPEFHNNLGIVYRRTGRFDEAVREFGAAIELEPEFREAHHNLALLYKLYLADEHRARQHFRSFLALGGRADQDVTALFRLAEEIR